jgi:asparagine synthase (glutamine-hydrolysing)
MCGIVGSLGNFERDAFERSLLRLAHRGPDGSDTIEDRECGLRLGHRRLAIVDLSNNGRQPMTDGDLTIIFNGEIYNWKEVRSRLETLGHTFRTESDTEVILKAFRQWGNRCLSEFNGMWAFAIWNHEHKTLFLSRDRFGVKPLFYAFTPKGFVFASEMKAIAPLLDEVTISSDFEWCKKNIYQYESSSKSLINAIKRFPSGHFAYITAKSRDVTAVKFWDTLDHLQTPPATFDEQVEKFRELFLDACRLRMRADVRIGTALSGGLDSSSVAAAMWHLGNSNLNGAGIQKDWQNAFVATFPGTSLDEKKYAEEVVSSFNLNGFFYDIDPVDGIRKLPDYLWNFEELYLTSPIPMIEIYKAIKKNGVSVSLDGHGADELLSGYGNMLFNVVKDNPFSVRTLREIASTYREMRGVDDSDMKLLVDGFAGRKNMLKFYLGTILPGLAKKSDLVERLGYFNAALYEEFHSYILPTLLRNYDRYSMAASVEVRMPFLDYRLVAYSFSIPWKSKVKDGFTKAILRKSMQPYLPEKIVKRKSKTGFGTPFTEWLRGPWKEFILDEVGSSAFNESQVLDPAAARQIVDRFYNTTTPDFSHGHKVWEALMPYFWEKSFFKRL